MASCTINVIHWVPVHLSGTEGLRFSSNLLLSALNKPGLVTASQEWIPKLRHKKLRLREVLEVRFKKHVILAVQRTNLFVRTVEKSMRLSLLARTVLDTCHTQRFHPAKQPVQFQSMSTKRSTKGEPSQNCAARPEERPPQLLHGLLASLVLLPCGSPAKYNTIPMVAVNYMLQEQ
eukprot:1148908-Pelagomonas_calceolata.AAC.1